MSKIKSAMVGSSVERLKCLFKITFSINIISNDLEEVQNHIVTWFQTLDEMDQDQFIHRLKFVDFKLF